MAQKSNNVRGILFYQFLVIFLIVFIVTPNSEFINRLLSSKYAQILLNSTTMQNFHSNLVKFWIPIKEISFKVFIFFQLILKIGSQFVKGIQTGSISTFKVTNYFMRFQQSRGFSYLEASLLYFLYKIFIYIIRKFI